jgi:hypothetical protein
MEMKSASFGGACAAVFKQGNCGGGSLNGRTPGGEKKGEAIAEELAEIPSKESEIKVVHLPRWTTIRPL